MLDCIASDPKRYRGVAIADDSFIDADYDKLNRGGVRGALRTHRFPSYAKAVPIAHGPGRGGADERELIDLVPQFAPEPPAQKRLLVDNPALLYGFLFDLVFAVNATSEYKTLADFVKAAKANPDKLKVGTIAVGGTQNLGAELFKSLADLKVQIVPYKNSPDVVVALLRNDVQMLVEFPPVVQGQVNDGKLRVLAVSSPKRSPLAPNIPTVDEAGVKGYDVTSWNAIFAPKGTPKDIIDTMNKAMREVLAMPEVKARFAKVGVVAQASTPDELMSRLIDDIKKWNAVIDKAGIARK